MYRLLVIISFLTGSVACAQNLNGIWKGKLVMAPGGCFPVYNIELQLQVAGSTITGTSYHFSDSLNYVKENLEGIFNRDSNFVSIQENGIITFRIKEDCVVCIKKFDVSYHKGTGSEEQLRGSWTGKATDGRTACEPGTIVLTRFDKSTFKPEPKLPPTLTKRKAELVKEIFVDTGRIKIDFYDNGQIDGDTISVYVNNFPVVTNRMLTAKPITVFVKVDLTRAQQEVIMVGENLGSIPPNTALMIINAGEKRYQLYLSSDEQKNALVRFIYKKPVSNH